MPVDFLEEQAAPASSGIDFQEEVTPEVAAKTAVTVPQAVTGTVSRLFNLAAPTAEMARAQSAKDQAEKAAQYQRQLIAGGGPAAGMAFIPPGAQEVPGVAIRGAVEGVNLVARNLRDLASEAVSGKRFEPEPIFGEKPEETEARRKYPLGAPGVPLYQPDIATPSDVQKWFSEASTPDQLLTLPLGATRTGAKILLGTMLPGVAEQIKQVASSEGSNTSKMDRIRDLVIPAVIGLLATRPEGVKLAPGRLPPRVGTIEPPPVPVEPVPPRPITGRELPGLPEGAPSPNIPPVPTAPVPPREAFPPGPAPKYPPNQQWAYRSDVPPGPAPREPVPPREAFPPGPAPTEPVPPREAFPPGPAPTAPVPPRPPEPAPAAPAAPAKPEVATLAPETNVGRNPFGDPSGTTYHATPEDWAEWQKVQAAKKELMGSKLDIKEKFQQMAPIQDAHEAIRNKYGGMNPEPPKEAKAAPAAPVTPEHVQSFEKESGFTFKPAGGVKIPDNLASLPPEEQALYAKIPKQWEFTDRRPGSKTEGVTFYVPEGANLEQIKAAHSAKMAEYEAAGKTQKMPDWVRERMQQMGLKPGRVFNDVDLTNPSVIEAIKSDPTLTDAQKDSLLKTGSLPEPAKPATIEETPLAGKTLADWEKVTDVGGLPPKGPKRAELAKWLAVPDQPQRIIQALANKKRTREIHAPPAPIEEVKPVAEKPTPISATPPSEAPPAETKPAVSETKPAETETKPVPAATPEALEAHLKVPVPDTAEAKARVQAIDSRRKELVKKRDHLDAEIKGLKAKVLTSKGWRKGKVKTSAKAADVARYREAEKDFADLSRQIQSLDETAHVDRNLIDDASSAAIINDPKQPLLRRLDRRIRAYGNQPIPHELLAARDAETARVIREQYPDATDAEIKRMAPEVQRAMYFGGDIWKSPEIPKPQQLRAAHLAAAINAPNVPSDRFPQELTDELNRYNASKRTYGGKVPPGAPLEELPAGKAEELAGKIQAASEQIRARLAEEEKARAAAVAADEAKQEQLLVEAQNVADSAKRAGTKGGRSASEVKLDLISRIKAAINDLIASDEIKLTRVPDAEDQYNVQGKTGAGFGYFEKTEKGKYKVTAQKPGGPKYTTTVDSPEEAEWVIKAMGASGAGKAVIGVPGDGVFRIFKDGPSMLSLWDKAHGIDTSSTRSPGIKTRGGAEKPPGQIRTEQDWRDALEYHGLEDRDKIYDWSPALMAFAEKVNAEAPQKVTVLEAQRWINDTLAKKRQSGIKPGEGVGPGAAARAEFTGRENRRRLLSDFVERLFGTRAAETFDALTRKAAGEAVPKTMARSGESGNAMVRFAASSTAAPYIAHSLVLEVLGDRARDAAFRDRLGAVLVEDRLRAIYDGLLRAGKPDEAANVNTLVGAGQPFRSEADFQAALRDPEIAGAIERHKQTVQAEAERFHTEAEGQLAGPGIHTGAFVNLAALFEDQPAAIFRGSGKGDYTRPFKRKSVFSRRAAGTAEKYETDYGTLAERMIRGNYEEYTKRQLYDQLVQDNLAAVLPPGAPRPTFEGKPGVKFQIKRQVLVNTAGGEARVIPQYENLWVDPAIASELRQAENIDGPIRQVALARVANVLNRLQLAGPTDAVWHTANMIGRIASSQGGKNLLTDIARKVPLANVVDAVVRVANEAKNILRDDPDTMRRISELAEIGQIRPNRPETGFTGRFINLVDKAGRVVRDKMYENLVNRGLVEASEAGRREWAGQLGQYNPRLMGQIESFFKEAGLSPFIVAGRNFNRAALRQVTLSPGVRAASLSSAVQMRAIEGLGVVTTLAAIPAAINFFTTGSPFGRKGVPFGAIDTGKSTKDGHYITIDPAQWVGLRRGMRMTGANALIEGIRRGELPSEIARRAGTDIASSIIHPWAGPVVQAGTIARTGYTTSGFKESKDPHNYWQNFLGALRNINPILHGWFQRKGGLGIPSAASSLAGAAGIKGASPYTAGQEIYNLAQKWKMDSDSPKLQKEVERRLQEDFGPSDYRDLRSALAAGNMDQARDAYETLLKTKTPADIVRTLEHPHPFTGSRANEVKFRASLTDEERELYQKALEERRALFQKFREMQRTYAEQH